MISVGQLGHGAAFRAIREAQDEPVLVSTENRPAAWIVGAQALARVAEARGVAPDVYQQALELIAVDLYRREAMTLGQAAKLAGLQLAAFIDRCGQVGVPILWEPEGGIGHEVDAFKAVMDDAPAGA